MFYIKSILTSLFTTVVIGAFCQTNIPNITATSASNTITNSVTYPAAYSLPANPKFNYVRTWIPARSMTSASLLVPITSAYDVNAMMSTNYFDGLGRSIQTINRAAAEFNDVIGCFDYRPGNTSISLLPYSGALNSKFRSNVFNEQKTYKNTKFLQEGITAFSMSEYTSSANDRTTSQYQPGKAFVGQKSGVKQYNELNVANEVISFNFDDINRLPVNAGYYAAGQLLKSIIKMASNNSEVIKYTDKEGKVICEKVKTYGPCGTSSCIDMMESYPVYDNLGRVVMNLPPKAIKLMQALPSGVTLADVVREHCSYSILDMKGRMIEKHIPGQVGNEFYVYDGLDRPVLVQTPALRQQGKWLFNVYDKKSRTIMILLYTNNSPTARATLQTLLDDPSTWFSHYNPSYFTYYLVWGQNSAASSPQYPVYYQTVPSAEIIAEYYYDDYTNTAVNSPVSSNAWMWYVNNSTHPNSINPELAATALGKLTGKKIKVLQPSNGNNTPSAWVKETIFYDRLGNVLQMVSDNAMGGRDLTTNQYTFTGQPIRSIHNHSNPNSTDKQSTQVVLDYEYFDNGKLKLINQNLDGMYVNGNIVWRKLVQHGYDEMGATDVKYLGEIIEAQYPTYNIRGQLTGINKPYAENPGSYPSQTFGESLKYDFGFTTPRNDGNVSGTIWRGSGSAPSRAYAYDYDPSGRLIKAEYSEFTKPPLSLNNTWNNNTGNYSVSNLKYDLNGNIKSMSQMATVNTGSSSSTVQMDDLQYNYTNSDASNRLQYVTDNVIASTNLTYNQKDFIDRNTGTNDYAYDDDGNIIKDLNKNISSMVYNHLGLPYEIVTVSGDHIYYTYDAEGNKLREQTAGTIGNATYDYIGQFMYKNRQFKLLNHTDGRCRWLVANNTFEYDYFVKDHLGNVRNVLTAEAYTRYQDYLATNELVAANTERLVFDNIDHTRDTRPEGFPGDVEAAMLVGNLPDRRIGPALAIRVMAGDKIHLKTYGYYDLNGDMNSHTTAEDMMGSIISTLSGGVQGLGGGDGGSSATINQLFTPNNYMDVFDALKEAQTDPEKPRAYLNYIFFDNNMHIIPDQSGVLQLNGDPSHWFEMDILQDIQVGQNGFLVAYLSNEQYMSVYFDNMLITHYRGRLLEEQHYYPHGLVINNSSIPSLVDRQKLYQTKEWNKDLALYDFHARQYDPQLGRFTSADPLGQFASGYVGMGNNPVTGIDPDGKWVNFVIGAVIGGVGGYMVGKATGATGGTMAMYIVAGAAIGAASSGASAAVSTGVSASMSVAASSSVAGAAVAGAAGGAMGGLISGFGMAILANTNPLKAAGKGALMGAAGGAIFGGLSRGIQNSNDGYDFWSGKGKSVYHVSTQQSSSSWSDARAKAQGYNASMHSRANNKLLAQKLDLLYGVKNGDMGAYFSTNPSPNLGLSADNLFQLKDGNVVEAITTPFSTGSQVQVSPGVMNYSDLDFQATVGHELWHAYHHSIIPLANFNHQMSENAAYHYSGSVYLRAGDLESYFRVQQTARMIGQWGDFDAIYDVPRNFRFSVY